MLKINPLYVLLAVLAVGGYGLIKYQETRIETLVSSLEEVEKVVKEQSGQINRLQLDFTRIQAMEEGRKESRTQRDTSDQKMTNDAKREKVVLAKPKLVETQINNSFDKFTLELQEATR